MMNILRIDIFTYMGRSECGCVYACLNVFSKFLVLKKMENVTTTVCYSVIWNDKLNCKGGLGFNVVKAPYILCRRDNPLMNPLLSIILNIILKSSLSLSFHLGNQRALKK